MAITGLGPIPRYVPAGNPLQGLGGTPQQAMSALGPAYQASYKSALDYNTQLGQHIDQGYRNLLDRTVSGNTAIGQGYETLTDQVRSDLSQGLESYGQRAGQVAGGYGTLGTNLGNLYGAFGGQQGVGYQNLLAGVMNQIGGLGATRQSEIDQQYARDLGRMQQDLINRGLGNSTVASSLQRGIMSDRERERTRLTEALAQMQAGYMADLGGQGLSAQRQVGLTGLDAQRQVGLTGLGYRGDVERDLLGQMNLRSQQAAAMRERGLQGQRAALGQEAELGLAQLGFLNSIQAPYPEVGMYSQLASMLGSQQQADADRVAIQQQIGGMGGGGMSSPQGIGGGYARASGRGLEPPRANYGGTPMLGTPGGYGMPAPAASPYAGVPQVWNSPFAGYGAGVSGAGYPIVDATDLGLYGEPQAVDYLDLGSQAAQGATDWAGGLVGSFF